MVNDSGAIPTGANSTISCSPCQQPVVGCSTAEEASSACRTPYCKDEFATLPKSSKGQLLKRVDTCLVTDPMNVGDVAMVWQRTPSGNDTLAPLSAEQIPARADAPCFKSINESEADTYGLALIAQTDAVNGKQCINSVPVEATDIAELAGWTLEPLCGEGTPQVRPIKIEPLDVVDECPEDIKFLGAVEIRRTVGTGLERVYKGWRWFTNIVQSWFNVPTRDGTEDDTMEYAVWIKNGDCTTLGRFELEEGVLGAWAWCGTGLKFYELPKGTDSLYVKNSVLIYNGGDNCWSWKTPDSLNDRCLEAVASKPTLATVSATTTKTGYDISPYDKPDCASYALIQIMVTSSPGTTTNSRLDVRNYLDDSTYTVVAGLLVGETTSNSGSILVTAKCPIFADNKVYFDYAKAGGTGVVQAVLTLTGFTD